MKSTEQSRTMANTGNIKSQEKKRKLSKAYAGDESLECFTQQTKNNSEVQQDLLKCCAWWSYQALFYNDIVIMRLFSKAETVL